MKDFYALETAVPVKYLSVDFDAQPAFQYTPEPGRETARFLLIDRRPLVLECLLRSIKRSHPRLALTAFGSVETCLATGPFPVAPDAVLMHIPYRDVTDPGVHDAIRQLSEGVAPVPVVVAAETEEVEHLVGLLECGITTCIPASMGLKAIVQTMRLAAVGGVVLTSECWGALRPRGDLRRDIPAEFGAALTVREEQVARALREGKANKIIAYELNMQESTVKIHVRSILKKLRVTNRTEAANKLNAWFESD